MPCMDLKFIKPVDCLFSNFNFLKNQIKVNDLNQIFCVYNQQAARKL
jgi:hypothetical protein